jgi:hypothetical protein
MLPIGGMHMSSYKHTGCLRVRENPSVGGVVLLAALSLVLLGNQAAFADTPASSEPTPPSADASASSSQTADSQSTSAQAGNASTTPAPSGAAKAPRVLQGGVQKFVLNLEKLRDVGLDLKQILKAASSLYDEVTIQPVELITEPEMINGVTINIPVGRQPIGPVQPARKDRVDLAMNAMTPIIDMMKKNVDEFLSGHEELALPDSVKLELKPQFSEWIGSVKVMASQEKELEQLTKQQPYDQQSIADLALQIHQDVRDLDKTRRSIYKVIRREGKKIAEAGTQD